MPNDLFAKIADYLDIALEKISIESSKRIIIYRDSPSVYYDMWVSYTDNGMEQLVNVYVPADNKPVLSGLKPDPYNISINTATKGMAYDTGNYADRYVYDFENGVFCFDANGKEHYSKIKEKFLKNFAVGVERSDLSTETYSGFENYPNDVAEIKKWYSGKIENVNFDVAVVFNTSGSTSASFVPSNVIKKSICCSWITPIKKSLRYL